MNSFIPHNIEVLILDLDSTVVGLDNSISAANISQIARVVSQGIKIIIATGRDFGGAKIILKKLNLMQNPHQLVCLNGALIIDLETEQRIESKPLSIVEKTQILAKLKEYQLQGIFFKGQKNNTGDLVGNKHHLKETNAFLAHDSRILLNLLSETKILANTYLSMIACGRHENINLFENFIRQSTDLMVFSGMENSTQISHADKATGVLKVMHSGKIPLKKALVIGDSLNDLTLFQIFPYSIAMGNAVTELKQIAFAQTETVSKDGVAKAIARYISKK